MSIVKPRTRTPDPHLGRGEATSASPERQPPVLPTRPWDSSRNSGGIKAIKAESAFGSDLSLLGRCVSLTVAVMYLVAAATARQFDVFLKVFMSLLVPMAAIWFPDALGGYVGGRITCTTPGVFVRGAGWVVLFIPLLALLIIALRT